MKYDDQFIQTTLEGILLLLLLLVAVVMEIK